MRYQAPMLEQAVGAAVVPHLNIQLLATKNEHMIPSLQMDQPATWLPFVDRIQAQPGQIDISFADDVPGPRFIQTTFTMRRRKQEQRLILEGQSQVDATLIKHLALAQELYAKTKDGIPLKDAADIYGIAEDKMRRLTQLMFLSPSIIEQAISGTLPTQATARWFSRTNLSQDFNEQVAALDAIA